MRYCSKSHNDGYMVPQKIMQTSMIPSSSSSSSKPASASAASLSASLCGWPDSCSFTASTGSAGKNTGCCLWVHTDGHHGGITALIATVVMQPPSWTNDCDTVLVHCTVCSDALVIKSHKLFCNTFSSTDHNKTCINYDYVSHVNVPNIRGTPSPKWRPCWCYHCSSFHVSNANLPTLARNVTFSASVSNNMCRQNKHN